MSQSLNLNQGSGKRIEYYYSKIKERE